MYTPVQLTLMAAWPQCQTPASQPFQDSPIAFFKMYLILNLYLNSNFITKATQCTFVGHWGTLINSFRVTGKTCSFNIDYTCGLPATEVNTVIAQNAPIPKERTNIPCILVKSDFVTYRTHVIAVELDGRIVNGIPCEFKDRIIACGAYEVV